MKRLLSALLLLAATLAAAPLRAQADDEAAVRAAITALFDAMRARDGDAVRRAFTADARLQTVAGRPDGTVELRAEQVENFASVVAAPSDQVWDERIDEWHVRVDGALAVATTDYSFFLGERFSHCGINVFQLLRTAEGWKIFQLVDTRRRAGCAAAAPAGE